MVRRKSNCKTMNYCCMKKVPETMNFDDYEQLVIIDPPKSSGTYRVPRHCIVILSNDINADKNPNINKDFMKRHIYLVLRLNIMVPTKNTLHL